MSDDLISRAAAIGRAVEIPLFGKLVKVVGVSELESLPSAQLETHEERTETHACDLISRQAAISLPVKPKEDRYFQTQNLDDAYDYGWYSLQKCIEKLPPAQPERKRGRWIMKYKGSVVTSYKCSECGRTVKDDTGYDVSKDYPFCHCGADMRGEQYEQRD